MKIRDQMKPLETGRKIEYSDSVVKYFEYYGLDLTCAGVEHIFGTFESNGETLTAHIFKPKKYKATVFMLHGYLNHCGQLKHLVKYLVESGFAVAAYDMQGHGLSSGERASIDDFSQYSNTLIDFVDVAKKHLNGPYHFVGFSNGASVAVDVALCGREDVFNKVVLLSPLIRNVAWEQSRAGFRFYSLFADSIPRARRENSSDKPFLEFNRTKDVLHVQTVSLKWVKALYDWNYKIADLQPCKKSVKVIQGTSDTTVDWKFNVGFIQDKFADVQVSLIDKGRHELCNESPDLREKVFSQITSYLEN